MPCASCSPSRTPGSAWRRPRRRRTPGSSSGRSAWTRSPHEEGLDYAWIEPGLSLLAAFDADTSGRHFEHGKPAPDIFLAAASELGVEPGDAFVIEDAVSGIQAAKAGGFAGLGLARADDEAALAAADADIVVTTLDEIDLAGLAQRRLDRRPG